MSWRKTKLICVAQTPHSLFNFTLYRFLCLWKINYSINKKKYLDTFIIKQNKNIEPIFFVQIHGQTNIDSTTSKDQKREPEKSKLH